MRETLKRFYAILTLCSLLHSAHLYFMGNLTAEEREMYYSELKKVTAECLQLTCVWEYQLGQAAHITESTPREIKCLRFCLGARAKRSNNTHLSKKFAGYNMNAEEHKLNGCLDFGEDISHYYNMY